MCGPRSTRSPKKHGLSPFGMSEGSVAPGRIIAVKLKRLIAELAEKGLQLVVATVQVANDVERPVVIPFVVPERSSLDDRRLDFLGRIEDEDVRESFPLQSTNRPTQLRLLLPNDVSPEAAIFPPTIPFLANLLRQIEDDGHGEAVILPAKLNERFAGFWLNVRGVHHGQMSQGQPLSGDEVQQLKCFVRYGLVVFVIGDHPPASIRGEYLRGQEVFAGKRALARATGADEDDEGEVGNGD